MDRMMNVLGTRLEDLDVCEAMERAAGFMHRENVSIMAVVTTKMLLAAGEDLEYREKLEALDLAVAGEREVLEAAGITEPERYQEAEEGWFVTSFLQYAAENQKSAVVFCETAQEARALERYLRKNFPELILADVFAREEGTEDADAAVNRINGTAADLVLASLGVPEQEDFAFENRAKLNVKLWLGLGRSLSFPHIPELKPGFWERLREKHIFRKKMTKFQQLSTDNYEE